MSDRPVANEAELHRAERCTEMHAAILGDRSAVQPCAIIREQSTGKVVLEQYRCPICTKLLERVRV